MAALVGGIEGGVLTIGGFDGNPVLMETESQDESFSYSVQLTPWQRRLSRLTHTHGIFEGLAWLNCSVPGFKGHFRPILNPGMKYRKPPQ